MVKFSQKILKLFHGTLRKAELHMKINASFVLVEISIQRAVLPH